MKLAILVLLFSFAVVAAPATKASAQGDSSTVAPEVLEQQQLVASIVQRVASGVLDIPADGQATSAQQQTIDSQEQLQAAKGQMRSARQNMERC